MKNILHLLRSIQDFIKICNMKNYLVIQKYSTRKSHDVRIIMMLAEILSRGSSTIFQQTFIKYLPCNIHVQYTLGVLENAEVYSVWRILRKPLKGTAGKDNNVYATRTYVCETCVTIGYCRNVTIKTVKGMYLIKCSNQSIQKKIVYILGIINPVI